MPNIVNVYSSRRLLHVICMLVVATCHTQVIETCKFNFDKIMTDIYCSNMQS